MKFGSLTTIGLLIIMALPATALAGGGGPPCDTDVTIQASLPDGDVTFTTPTNKSVTVIVKHWYESGRYYSAASTTLQLRPGITAQTGDAHVVALHVDGKTIALHGSRGFEALVKHAQIKDMVTHVLDEGHVGFRVDLTWSYVTEKGDKSRDVSLGRHRAWLGNPHALTTRRGSISDRPVQPDRTSKRDGFHWYQSPLMAAKIDWKTTTRNVLRCNLTPRVVKTANPPLSGPKRHAKR